MQPLDLYKKLPRKDCGECSTGTCMSFAVQLIRKLVPLSECPELDIESAAEIEAMISDGGDWKEKRLYVLLDEVNRAGFSNIADGIGAATENDCLKIKYMGRNVSVSPSGFEDDLDIWDKLLIVMYIKQAGKSPPTGKWVAFRELKDGLIRSESFHGACELSLAKVFENNMEGFIERLVAMGAEKVSGHSTRYSFIVYPLPRIPFLVLLWPPDEEFGAACKILMDSNVTDYLDVEALLYLGMALARAVK